MLAGSSGGGDGVKNIKHKSKTQGSHVRIMEGSTQIGFAWVVGAHVAATSVRREDGGGSGMGRIVGHCKCKGAVRELGDSIRWRVCSKCLADWSRRDLPERVALHERRGAA